MPFPKSVKLVEVGPRDGLQNEEQMVPLEKKIELINALSETGLSVIETTSFVSPKWIPQLADSKEVFERINKKKGIQYPVLIPNLKGLERALSCGVKEIALFTTPSEKFSQANTHCSVAESLVRMKEVLELAKKHHLTIRVYLSCVLGCPYEGEMPIEKVVRLIQTLMEMGFHEFSLGDTIGVGTPFKTQALLRALLVFIPVSQLGVHFHDTYGQALVNIYAALEYGIATIDSSVAGLGGCPYAKGASGNVATEDVLYMLDGMGIKTGVNLKKLIKVGQWICQVLDKKNHSKVSSSSLS